MDVKRGLRIIFFELMGVIVTGSCLTWGDRGEIEWFDRFV